MTVLQQEKKIEPVKVDLRHYLSGDEKLGHRVYLQTNPRRNRRLPAVYMGGLATNILIPAGKLHGKYKIYFRRQYGESCECCCGKCEVV